MLNDHTYKLNTLAEQHRKAKTSLAAKHSGNIAAMTNKYDTQIATMKTRHPQALTEAREVAYESGQTEKRTSMQSQIDSIARQNMANGDWNAPVYTLRK
jgi:effector-binding domain-containing protein